MKCKHCGKTIAGYPHNYYHPVIELDGSQARFTYCFNATIPYDSRSWVDRGDEAEPDLTYETLKAIKNAISTNSVS